MELTVDVVGRGGSFGLTPDELIPSREAKLHCILNYFCRVMSKMPEGKLTFHRRVVDTDISWLEAAVPVLPVHTVPKGYIEEAAQCVQADFAASGVGGGVLTNGSLMVRLFPQTARRVCWRNVFWLAHRRRLGQPIPPGQEQRCLAHGIAL